MPRAVFLGSLILLSACVSSSVVYQRSLRAEHLSAFARRIPRTDFDEIARLLSHTTRQSIVDVHPGIASNQLVVDTAYPNPTSYAQYGQFIVEKRDGQWRVVGGFDQPIPTG
jgi:hypothetical protein